MSKLAKKIRSRPFALLRAKLQARFEGIEDEIKQFVAQVGAMTPSDIIPQAAIETALCLESFADSAHDAAALFKTHALTHRAAGGVFQIGKAALVFTETAGQRRPKWKEEAVELGSAVAKLQGLPFDEEVFCKMVTDKYPPGESRVSVRLVMT